MFAMVIRSSSADDEVATEWWWQLPLPFMDGSRLKKIVVVVVL